jgi:hypothetical protein
VGWKEDPPVGELVTHAEFVGDEFENQADFGLDAHGEVEFPDNE